MLNRPRIIPVLLLKGEGLVKGRKFKNHIYVGDPFNTVKIFNNKMVDELVFFDIMASDSSEGINFSLIKDIVSECFSPVAYGGGICNLKDIEKVLSLGVEKIVLNTVFHEDLTLVKEAIKEYGSSTIVVSIDVKKDILGKYKVYKRNGRKRSKYSLEECIRIINDVKPGEVILNSIDRDGMLCGYDLELIQFVSGSISMPLVACGGARDVSDYYEAIKFGSSGAGAGASLVFKGKHRAVLITYPNIS